MINEDAISGENNSSDNSTQPGNVRQAFLLLRKSIEQEVIELKNQVLLIQQQSSKNMQDAAAAMFKQQAALNLQQITQQEKKAESQMKAAIEANQQMLNKEMHQTDETLKNETPAIQKQYNNAMEAMLAAQQGVENALRSAMSSLQEAENILKKAEDKPAT